MTPDTRTPWTADADIPARGAASMLLTKVGSIAPWSLIALDPGLPAAFATVPGTLIARTRRSGTWRSLLGALDDPATLLEQSPPPIDYSVSRWAAADPARLNETIRLVLADATGGGTDMERAGLAALVWHAYTGGDARYHPQYGAEAPARGLETATSPDAGGALLVGRVATELHRLARYPDCGALEWRPP